MKVICSWCREEGRNDLIAEKAPLDDPRETHSICKGHRSTVDAELKEKVRGSGLLGRTSPRRNPET